MDLVQVNRQTLLREGLHFNYFTSEVIGEDGLVFRCCYEYGYADIGQGRIVVAVLGERDEG